MGGSAPVGQVAIRWVGTEQKISVALERVESRPGAWIRLSLAACRAVARALHPQASTSFFAARRGR